MDPSSSCWALHDHMTCRMLLLLLSKPIIIRHFHLQNKEMMSDCECILWHGKRKHFKVVWCCRQCSCHTSESLSRLIQTQLRHLAPQLMIVMKLRSFINIPSYCCSLCLVSKSVVLFVGIDIFLATLATIFKKKSLFQVKKNSVFMVFG